MQAGKLGSLCFLAYLASLLIVLQAKDLHNADLKEPDAKAAEVEQFQQNPVTNRADIKLTPKSGPTTLTLTNEDILRLKAAQNNNAAKTTTLDNNQQVVNPTDVKISMRTGIDEESLNENDRSFQSFQGPTGRLVSFNEIVYPNRIPGVQNVIQCTKEGDLYYLTLNECHVCTCVREGFTLVAKCAKCNQCGTNPTEVTTQQPKSCFPFPTLEPFQNPINPCQTCFCKPTFNQFGASDISIVCENNRECLIPIPPVEPTTIRPIIIPPVTPSPVPPPTPPTPAPVPWPPKPEPTPRPSPLPGPGPHESCAPYKPNLLFQHPWDECQVCVCSERRNLYSTEIELTCHTKAECCYVPNQKPGSEYEIAPQQSVYLSPVCQFKTIGQVFNVPGNPCHQFVCRQAYNQVYVELIYNQQCQQNELIVPDEVCKYRTIGTEFQHPSDGCKVCRCEVYGSILAPSCQKSPRFECSNQLRPVVPENSLIFLEPRCKYAPPNQEFTVGCNLCRCNTVFNYVTAHCLPQPSCEAYPTPNVVPPQPPQPQQQPTWVYPTVYPSQGSSQASSQASASGQYGSQSNANAQSSATINNYGQNPYPTFAYGPSGQINGQYPSQGWLLEGQGGVNGQAQAQASSQSQTNYYPLVQQPDTYYPQTPGFTYYPSGTGYPEYTNNKGYPNYNTQNQQNSASALVEASSGSNQIQYPGNSGFTNYYFPQQGQSQNQQSGASATASAAAESNSSPNQGPQFPYPANQGYVNPPNQITDNNLSPSYLPQYQPAYQYFPNQPNLEQGYQNQQSSAKAVAEASSNAASTQYLYPGNQGLFNYNPINQGLYQNQQNSAQAAAGSEGSSSSAAQAAAGSGAAGSSALSGASSSGGGNSNAFSYAQSSNSGNGFQQPAVNPVLFKTKSGRTEEEDEGIIETKKR